MKKISLSFFASSTPSGMELVNLVDRLFSNQSVAGMQVEMRTILDGDQADMMIAGLQDDIVIFDASVEDSVGSNYKAAQMWPSCMEHFLVVSRTRLPLNFQAFHEGGTPETSKNIIEHPFALDNDYLVNWIQTKLKFLEPQLPRPQNERLDIQKNQVAKNFKDIHQLEERLIHTSIETRGKYQKTQGRAFVSYLSLYSQHCKQARNFNGFYVEHLIDHIKKDFHHESDYSVLYYPPGTLSSEFMTEHRRWQVLSIIDWRIRATDEFWIFETDDYYDSWWTLAELASLAYIKHSYKLDLSQYTLPKIFLCKPTTNGLKIRQLGLDFVQNIDPEMGRDFGRYLSNSDPLTMGYESVRNIQMLRKFPIPFQWIVHKGVGFLTDVVMANSPMYQEMNKSDKPDFSSPINSFSRYREMINSHVFSESFYNDRIVTCPHCRKHNQAKEYYDFQKFLSHQQEGQFRVFPEEMQEILESGLWTCKTCGMQFYVISEDEPQFRWWPVRMGCSTGPNGVYVEKLPVYSLQRVT